MVLFTTPIVRARGGGHALLSLLFVSFRLEGVSTPSLGTIGLQTYILGETKVSKNFLLNQESLRDFGNLFQSSNGSCATILSCFLGTPIQSIRCWAPKCLSLSITIVRELVSLAMPFQFKICVPGETFVLCG